jgi:type 1 glutamine amidotransferase
MIPLTRLLIILLAFVTTAVAQERKARALLIGTPLDHPPRSHMYLHECGVLEKCLRQTPGIETVISDGWPKDAALIEGVTCVVLYSNPGGNIVLAPENRPAAQKLFDAGCGFVAIHWATDCAVETGQDYLKLLGGWWGMKFGGLDVRDTRLVQINPAHPICRGWRDFDTHDEIYLRTVLMNTTQPLIKVAAGGGEQIVAWTFERPDGGRSFGTTLGHFHEVWRGESFRRLIVNAILWAAKLEVPEAGAPVALSEEALALPPDPREKTQ